MGEAARREGPDRYRVMKRKRSPRRGKIDMGTLLAVVPALATHDKRWISEGYERTSARVWRSGDGTFTARLVWRNRELPGNALVSTVTYTLRGVALA